MVRRAAWRVLLTKTLLIFGRNALVVGLNPRILQPRAVALKIFTFTLKALMRPRVIIKTAATLPSKMP